MPLIVIAGVLFGTLLGSILSWLGAMIGAVIGYWVARTIGHDVITRWLKRFKRVDAAVARGAPLQRHVASSAHSGAPARYRELRRRFGARTLPGVSRRDRDRHPSGDSSSTRTSPIVCSRASATDGPTPCRVSSSRVCCCWFSHSPRASSRAKNRINRPSSDGAHQATQLARLFRARMLRQLAPLRTTTPKQSNVGTRKTDRRATRRRLEYIIIECVTPELDGGRYPVKRIIGDAVFVGADILKDGHDLLGARVLFKGPGDDDWSVGADVLRLRLRSLVRRVSRRPIGRWTFTVEAWTDRVRHVARGSREEGRRRAGRHERSARRRADGARRVAECAVRRRRARRCS